MRQICKFCPKRDVRRHVPDLTVDIALAIESGTIPPTASVDDFNNLDMTILQNATRLRDPFDALEYGTQLSKYSSEFSSGTGNTSVNITPSTPPAEGSGN